MTGRSLGFACTLHSLCILSTTGRCFSERRSGVGPQRPVKGRAQADVELRFPTPPELTAIGLEFERKAGRVCATAIRFIVVKGIPGGLAQRLGMERRMRIRQRRSPRGGDAVYRSIHRLVSKVMVCNDDGRK